MKFIDIQNTPKNIQKINILGDIVNDLDIPMREARKNKDKEKIKKLYEAQLMLLELIASYSKENK